MNFNILVVDDNRENLQVVGSLLRKKEYNVIAADNAQDAIDFAVRKIPDLILLDIMMPGEDGYSVCRRLKNRNMTKKIPVIFLTAKQDQESLQKAFEIGGIDYISKPFNKYELLARIKAQLDLQAAYREIRHLRGLLPICFKCKKIRDDNGYWQEIEQYITANSEVDFSHSICEDCAEKFYPEFMKKRKEHINKRNDDEPTQ